MSDRIFVVWARRGDYSDRTEYAVCWFRSESEANAEAARLQHASDSWRSRAQDGAHPWLVTEQAQRDIGDEQWSSWDHTTYSVQFLCRGRGEGRGRASQETP